jgi:hypothetical protein
MIRAASGISAPARRRRSSDAAAQMPAAASTTNASGHGARRPGGDPSDGLESDASLSSRPVAMAACAGWRSGAPSTDSRLAWSTATGAMAMPAGLAEAESSTPVSANAVAPTRTTRRAPMDSGGGGGGFAARDPAVRRPRARAAVGAAVTPRRELSAASGDRSSGARSSGARSSGARSASRARVGRAWTGGVGAGRPAVTPAGTLTVTDGGGPATAGGRAASVEAAAPAATGCVAATAVVTSGGGASPAVGGAGSVGGTSGGGACVRGGRSPSGSR